MVKAQNRLRLKIERVIMIKELPQFRFFQTGDDTYFSGWHTTAYTGQRFLLKLQLSPFFPDEIPKLYVIKPKKLKKYGGGDINSIGSSHSFHTNPNGPEGVVEICHFEKGNWNASRTCVGVFFKGILWLEAYDLHLKTGRDIAVLIDEIKKRQ
jgi:hypothetical protein